MISKRALAIKGGGGVDSDDVGTLKFNITSFFKQTALPWVGVLRHKPFFTYSRQQQKGMFDCVEQLTARCAAVFGCFEYSLSPILKSKFHKVSITKSDSSDSKRLRFLVMSLGYALRNHTFNLLYLQNSLKRRFECNSNEHLDINWYRNTIDIVKAGGKCTKGLAAPEDVDYAQTPTDFLLEPCVIIQLPWNTVMLHQWLVAAFSHILLFERETLELRHWSIPEHIEPVARELVFMVKQVKDRIFLGFAILNEQMKIHPQVDMNHPGWIMDDVVLPSLSTLQFLADEKSKAILKSIKRLSWVNSFKEEGRKRLYLPAVAFEPEHRLWNIMDEVIYSPQFWNLLLLGPTYCTALVPKRNKLAPIINDLNNNTTLPEASSSPTENSIKNYSKEENEIITNNALITDYPRSKGSTKPQDNIDKTVKFIKDVILENFYLPSASGQKIINGFKHCSRILEGNDCLFAIDPKEVTKLELSMIHSIFYTIFNKTTTGCGERKSALTSICHLQLQTCEREQILKVTNALSLQYNISPMLASLISDKTKPMEVKEMMKIIEDVKSIGSGQRHWLRFPKKWKRHVNPEEPEIDPKLDRESVIKICEERIGRIIYNVAQSSPTVFQKGGDGFPHWHTVQYILPCICALYSEKFATDGHELGKVNFIKFLHELLKYFEASFHTWRTLAKPRYIPDRIDPQRQLLEDHVYYKTVLTNTCSRIVVLMKTHLKPDENYVINHIKKLKIVTYEWMKEFLLAKYDELAILEYTNVWLLMGVHLFDILHQACLKAWNSPKCLKLEGYTGINELYFEIDKMCFLDQVVRKVVAMFIILKGLENVEISDDLLQGVYSHMDQIDKLSVELFTALLLPSKTTEKSGKVVAIGKKMKTELLNHLQLVKQLRSVLDPPELARMLHRLSAKTEQQREIEVSYLNGRISDLQKCFPFVMQTAECTFEKVDFGNMCRHCKKYENGEDKFDPCEKCIQDKYPDVNYFCSVACKNAWWDCEHMAEHLEFELGLADFPELDLGK